MIRRGKPAAEAAAAAAKAQAAAEAAGSSMPSIPRNIRHGAWVTLAFFVLLYLFIMAQVVMKTKLRAYYASQGKKFERYSNRERKMLGWDRTVGNMMEQALPFLGLFWLNIYLSEFGGLPLAFTTFAGWAYVILRSMYPMLWFNGGGGHDGVTKPIRKITYPMYGIIAAYAVNAAVTLCMA